MTEDEARDILKDPEATAARLARIASEFPDLRIDVVNHPGVTSGILLWLMKYGDDDVRTAIADWAAPPTQPKSSVVPSAEPAFVPYPEPDAAVSSEPVRTEKWVDNRHALIPPAKGSPPIPSTGYASLGLTPRDQHIYPVSASSSGTYSQTMRYISNDAPSAGYAVLGFLIPIVGLILYIVWKDETPMRASSAGKGALISFLLSIGLVILRACLSVASS